MILKFYTVPITIGNRYLNLYCEDRKSQKLLLRLENTKLSKIAVIGSRRITFNRIHEAKSYLITYYKNSSKIIMISGGAKGADSLAENFAQKNNIPFIKILPTLYINHNGTNIPYSRHQGTKKYLLASCAINKIIPPCKLKYYLIRRNLIIAWLSNKIIPLSIPKNSGTLYTIFYGILLNKEIVFPPFLKAQFDEALKYLK